MIYRTLGRTGTEVSAIALGCEGFVGMSVEDARSLMSHAVEHGVNFMDIYSSDPDLRSTLGEVLRDYRDRFVVQGHLCSTWKNNQYERTRNMAETRSSFEDLLKRLNMESIDIGMIHYVDAMDDYHTVFDGEIIRYAQKLRSEGVIRSVGLSSHNPVVACKAVESGLIDVLMFSINPCYDMQPPDENVEKLMEKSSYEKSLHNFDADRRKLCELCERKGVGIDVMKVYGGGDLLSSSRSPFGRAFTPVQCLNYALTRPAVASVMVGCRSIPELDQSLSWCDAEDDAKDYSTVLAGLDHFTWSGHCMYCGHCAPCPEEIRVSEVFRYYNLATSHSQIPETVREHYRLLEHHAGECIGCGQCEQRCPFGVSIRQDMRKVAELFGN